MIALLFSVASSFALDGAISFEVGSVGGAGPNDTVFDGTGMPGLGGRVGLVTGEHTQLVAGWRYGARLSRVLVGDDQEWDDGNEFGAALRTHVISVGERFDAHLTDVVAPYALAEGFGVVGTALFDGIPWTDDNLTRDRRTGVTGGVAGLLGCEIHAKQGGAAFAPAIYGEVGYAYAAPLGLGDYGRVPVHGAIGGIGVGVRF